MVSVHRVSLVMALLCVTACSKPVDVAVVDDRQDLTLSEELAPSQGELSVRAIQRVTDTARGTFAACAPNRSVTAHVRIDVDGRVAGVRLLGVDEVPAAIQSCLVRAVRVLVFDKPAGGSVTVKIPLRTDP
jgi:hypothetical protein